MIKRASGGLSAGVDDIHFICILCFSFAITSYIQASCCLNLFEILRLDDESIVTNSGTFLSLYSLSKLTMKVNIHSDHMGFESLTERLSPEKSIIPTLG